MSDDRTLRIFVSGPYSRGDHGLNLRRVIDAADELLTLGFAPFVPHTMSDVWHIVYPHPWDRWVWLCLQWLPACDAVLRLPGDSPGAEVECAEARRLGLPIFHAVSEVLHWRAEAKK